jgi:peptidoglycan/xylan/chitin deacetylase (PgdA/CDA1 family)
MVRPVAAKRVLKYTAGLASVVLRRSVPPSRTPAACVLLYHRVSPARVADRWLDDWNVTPAALEQQVAWLTDHAELVFARELRHRLRGPAANGKPVVCLTFDDGFRNFHDEVLPILRRHHAKATVFVVTGYLGSQAPMPFDRWGLKHASDAPSTAWQPLDWEALERCAASGVVEVGGHSHRHRNAVEVTDPEVADEAATSRELLLERLGSSHANCYAYPYGSSRLGQVTDPYLAAVKAAGYHTALTTNVGLATAESDPLAFPRVEVVRTDSPSVIRAKVSGSLAPFLLLDRLRRARR